MISNSIEKVKFGSSSSSSSSSSSEEDPRSIAEIEKDIELLEEKIQVLSKNLTQTIENFMTTQPEGFSQLCNVVSKIKDLKFKNHIVTVFEEILDDELNALDKILESFPNKNNNLWPVEFAKLNIENIPKKLLKLAANARDYNDRSIVGIAAQHGDPQLLQKLIDMGAILTSCDEDKKTVIYWAICNELSCSNKNSYEAAQAVKIILNNNIDIDKTCNNKDTPLQYAKKHGYIAALNCIEEKIEIEKVYTQGAVIGMFRKRLMSDISVNIASFFKLKDGIASSLTCKQAYICAYEKKFLLKKNFF
jgi:hypothetical protein